MQKLLPPVKLLSDSDNNSNKTKKPLVSWGEFHLMANHLLYFIFFPSFLTQAMEGKVGQATLGTSSRQQKFHCLQIATLAPF